MNCGLCGRHLSRFEMQKWKKDGRPICRECRKEELRKNVEMASPSQIQFLKLYTDDADLIDEIIRERKLKEYAPAEEPMGPKKDEHGCIVGVETWNTDLHQCVKIKEPKSPESKKDAHGCLVGVEEWNDDLHQCVKIEKHPPTHEQIKTPPSFH